MLLGPLDHWGNRAVLDKLEIMVHKARLVLQGNLVSLGLSVQMVSKVYAEILAYLVAWVSLVQLVHPVGQAMQDYLEHKDLKDLKEVQEPLVNQE